MCYYLLYIMYCIAVSLHVQIGTSVVSYTGRLIPGLSMQFVYQANQNFPLMFNQACNIKQLHVVQKNLLSTQSCEIFHAIDARAHDVAWREKMAVSEDLENRKVQICSRWY